MKIHHVRSMSFFGFALLLAVTVISLNNAVAQDLVGDWISFDRTGSTPAGFPRWISLDPSLSAKLPAAAESHPQAHPLAHTNPTFPASRPPVDGTWREDGQYVIIELDGRELRLRKTPATVELRERHDDGVRRVNRVINQPYSTVAMGGTVLGRLMNRGRPLVNCKVSLMPLRKTLGGYTIDARAEPQSEQTGTRGNYRFENVPRGPYKLFWLPAGQRQWIRRIEFKPDVFARTQETLRIKEIRVALRTIN